MDQERNDVCWPRTPDSYYYYDYAMMFMVDVGER